MRVKWINLSSVNYIINKNKHLKTKSMKIATFHQKHSEAL